MNWISQLLPRLKAAGIHFFFSALFVIAVMLFCGLVWYPGVLVWAAGMSSLMVVLVVVDLVLGPVLTGVVYQPSKKSLKFDLAVIVAIQLSALAYGVHTIYQARPVFIVFTVDRFEAVAAKDIETDRPEFSRSAFSSISLTGPRMVGARMPTDPEERNTILLSKVQTGAGLALMPEYYVELGDEIVRHLDKATPLTELDKHNEIGRIQAVLSHHADRSDQLKYFPLVAQDKDMTILVDESSGNVVDIVDLRPWS